MVDDGRMSLIEGSCRRLKVLVSAFACSPYRGSEDGVGWNIVSRLGAHHDVTVLYGDYGADNRSERELLRWIADNGNPEGVKFVYVPQGAVGKVFLWIAHYGKRLFPPFVFVFYYAYRAWLREAFKRAAVLHVERPFDVAHQLTYVSYREPGYLWRLKIPFVWGPVSGASDVPWRYYFSRGVAGFLRFFFRDAINIIHRRGTSYVRAGARKARKIWVVSKDDYLVVGRIWGCEATYMPETGCAHSAEVVGLRRFNADRPLVIAWSGSIDPRKALDLLLRAIGALRDPGAVNLVVIGDGPEKARCERLAIQLGIDGLIEWRGRVSHAEAKSALRDADIFCLSSLREATSTVIMEAMAVGLPVVCHDACGMAEVVDNSCGIKVSMAGPKRSVVGFRDAIQSFLDRPALLEELSRGAFARAADLTWDKKVEEMAETYRTIASATAGISGRRGGS